MEAQANRGQFRGITAVLRHIQLRGPDAPMSLREISNLEFVVKRSAQMGNKLSPEIERLVEVTVKHHGLKSFGLAAAGK